MSNLPVSRRDFLRVGAATGMAAAALPAMAPDKEPSAKSDKPIAMVPKRKLGKHDIEVSMLGQGAGRPLDERHLNLLHESGVRYLDTAKVYGNGASERAIADWFEKTGYRKEYFLVTKDQPRTPADWVRMLDERLVALKTDYIDLLFLHALGDEDYLGADGAKVLTDKEWADTANKMRESGKVRLLGFSSHARPIENRIALLSAAASKESWVDAIMVATNPTVMRSNKSFSDAITACHRAGVGLVSMKESYTGSDTIDAVIPEFKKRGLSRVTAVMTAMWTDGRFASVCSQMDNLKYVKENSDAAKNYKPLTEKELAAIDRMYESSEHTLCVACDGSCQRAAGTRADLNTIARYVTYLERNGRLAEARALFAVLPPDARNWAGADLAAAQQACKCKMDFARILRKAEQFLA